ncbi:MAG: SAM-dependent methyltransferase [Candidatus Bathyarchaeota archaeon]|nr:SAM-dependent methyltransferase [Candidatus Bathyarchaeota archaeon]MDW8040989.1 SAM-dependent methyltransferase [Nitrososphaerota archaeon]
MTKLIFVIEHLEPELGKWLIFEYEHVSEIVGKDRLMFTNVKKTGEWQLLSRFGMVEEKSAAEIFNHGKVIILDPKAEHPLKPEDFAGKEAVIVGGILGDHPPKGRTRKLLTKRFPKAMVRHIGRWQFSIDGAVYVAMLVSEGTPLEAIPVKKGLTLKLNGHGEVYLPYAYPLRDGKPLISQRLVAYLCSNEIVKDEERLLKGEL